MNHPIHYFIHVPKTAGVTIRHWLLQAFARDEVLFVYRGQIPEDPTALSFWIDEIIARVAELPAALKLLFGHFPFDPSWFVHPGCRGLGFVREPRARIVSWRRYVERRGPVLPDRRLGELALQLRAGMGLREASAAVGGIAELDNGIVRMFANAQGPVGSVDESVLARALDHIDQHFDFVGHLDHFESSMHRIAAILGREYRPQPEQNRSGARRSEDELALEDRDWLESLVAFDDRLVASVLARFHSPDDSSTC